MDLTSRTIFRTAGPALLRATPHAGLQLPAWPEPACDAATDARRGCQWLREVWALEPVVETIEHASPGLAKQVEKLCAASSTDARRVQRTVQSVSRYLLRMTGRATPFGLFAGVAPVSFDTRLHIHWGEGHRPVARADAAWLAAVTARLESCPQLLNQLRLTANNLCFVRGGRVVVPHQPTVQSGTFGQPATADVSIRYTEAVRIAMEAAVTPIRTGELAGKLAAEFPGQSPAKIGDLVTQLVQQGALVSNLRAPSTSCDPLRYLLAELAAAGADEIPEQGGLLGQLREIHTALELHNRTATSTARRALRDAAAEQMTIVGGGPGQRLSVDLRLDCTLVLPAVVAREAEAAASVLARLTADPFGTPGWQSFHTRFFERYGAGSLVPLMDVVDSDVGLGFPAGYPSGSKEPRGPVTVRDERLLALAQRAALDGRIEVVLDERQVAELAAPGLDRAEVTPHLELCFQVQAASQAAIQRGEFDLAVVSASRAAGTMWGRFVHLLEPADRERIAAAIQNLPTTDPDALSVQLSFPPVIPGKAHVTRVPQLLPEMITLAEHRDPDNSMIDLVDLAVGCDGHRLYLASISRRRRLEPRTLHALDFRAHTPPLARFLSEVSRAQAAITTGFDWRAAACLPFLPRVRFRRTILSPARWRLTAADLPPKGAPWPHDEIARWQLRHRIPDLVHLGDGDQRLAIDLSQALHVNLLRAHLNRAGHTVLTEAPGQAHSWFGGRTHEIVLPLRAAQTTARPPLPPVTRARVIGRDHGHQPATSPWLYVKLYGHRERQAEIIAEYLPGLLAEWDEAPAWWFVRYADPDWHLRLRIKLPDPRGFGLGAQRVSTWARELHRLGLVREISFASYYPETGRWGRGPAMAMAESVFEADSRALAAQFAAPLRPRRALTAANAIAIAIGFTGGTAAGMNWLVERSERERSTEAITRDLLVETARMADPADGWAALRETPGGPAIAAAWAHRQQALAEYRSGLHSYEDVDADAVLTSLLHAHHIRAVGADPDDETNSLRLARAVAMAWTARLAASKQ